MEAGKVMNILYPISLFTATYDFLKTLYALKSPKLKAAYEASIQSSTQKQLEAELANPTNLPRGFSVTVDEDATAAAAKRVEQEKNAPMPKASDITKIALPGMPAPSSPPPKTENALPTQSRPISPPDTMPGNESPDSESSFDVTYPLRLVSKKLTAPWTHGSDISKATYAALARLMHDAHVRDVVMVRGDVLVKGLVEVSGTRGMIQIKVNGYVDAKTRKIRLSMVSELMRAPPDGH